MHKKYAIQAKTAITGFLFITLIGAILMIFNFIVLPDQITTEIKISDLKSPDFNDSTSSSNTIKVTFEPKRDMIGLLRFENMVPAPGFDATQIIPARKRLISAKYEKRTGLVICRTLISQQDKTEKTSLVYMGPNGIAAKSDSALGRFQDPLLETSILSSFFSTLLLYDPPSRQFYSFDPFALTYTKGLPIGNDIQPLKISTPYLAIGNRNWALSLSYPAQSLVHPDHDALVLDKTGAIYSLNTQTLTLSNCKGFIPHCNENPMQMLAFAALHRMINFKDVYIIASATDNGDALHVRIYDDNANLLYTNVNYTSALDARLITSVTAQSFLPFISCVSSYCLGPYFTAMDSYQSFYLVPHVLLAATSRMTDSRLIMPMFFLFWPLLLGVIFATITIRNAKQLGVEKESCCTWFIVVLFLGLPAFLTWLCLRPRVTMITCNNCGLPRRPDTEKCHHCCAKLELPSPQNTFAVKN